MQDIITLLGITMPEKLDMGCYLCYNVKNSKSK